MSKRLLLWVALVLLPGYSYSNEIKPYYDQTGNAAINGNNWDMGVVLPPDIPGLDIQNIIYNYTIQKQTEDKVEVHIQNENALGSGYIFRETDTWQPGSLGGTEINKIVPIVPNIPREAWGDGSIAVDGPGSVTDPNVVYTYRVDPCYDPQSNPSCPGWKAPSWVLEIPEYELYDATKDSQISQYEDKAKYSDDEEEPSEEDELSEDEENAIARGQNADMFAQAFVQAQQLAALNAAINMTQYYSATIPGGVYTDNIQLNNARIPENRKGLRNGLAQQILHEQMIEMQYNR